MAPPKKSSTKIPTTASAKGVVYARYSSHNQKEESIEQQVDECMAFAAANNIEITQVYADKAISGKTDKRNQFQRMMRDAEKKSFDIVVAYKSNRISRNMLQALTYEAKLDAFGIKTLYAKEEFGNTAAGRFALRTMMNVNQFYSENMAEDIKRGMADNAANCKVNGRLPIGYKKGSDNRYAVDEDGASIVREIYEKVLSGVPFADIANDLNGRGVKTGLGKRWNKNSFHALITNDNYIGVYRHSGVVVEDGIPPIIEREMFYAVQEKLVTKKNPMGRTRENGDYLLTGKLHCGYCNSFMVGISGTSRTGDLHYYYTCNKRRTESSCNKKNVRRDWIERRIAELTKKLILKDETINWIAESAVSIRAGDRRGSDIASMEADLAEDKKATKNIMTAIERGIITETTKERLLELELDISNIEKAIMLAKAANEPLEKDRIAYSLSLFKNGDIDDKSYQKGLIDTFVKAVYLWDDRIRIDYYYMGKKNSFTFSFDGESEADDWVLISALEGHHKRVIRTNGQEATIYLTADGFVLLCPLSIVDNT